MINNNKGSRIYICGVDNRSLGGDVPVCMYMRTCVITRGSLHQYLVYALTSIGHYLMY